MTREHSILGPSPPIYVDNSLSHLDAANCYWRRVYIEIELILLDNLTVFESILWMSQLAACVYASVIIQFVQSNVRDARCR